MFNISQYLEKFKNIGETERSLKEVLARAIKVATNIEIEIKNIIIKNNEAFIKVSPIIKNTIYIKKEQILKLVKEKINQGIRKIGEIR